MCSLPDMWRCSSCTCHLLSASAAGSRRSNHRGPGRPQAASSGGALPLQSAGDTPEHSSAPLGIRSGTRHAPRYLCLAACMHSCPGWLEAASGCRFCRAESPYSAGHPYEQPCSTTCMQASQGIVPTVCRRNPQALAQVHAPDVQGLKCTDLSLTYQTIMCLLWQESWCPRGSANCVFPKCNLNNTLAARLQASWSPKALSSCMGPRGASSHPLDGSIIPRSGGSLITGQGAHLLKKHRPTHNQHSLRPTPTTTLSWVGSLA